MELPFEPGRRRRIYLMRHGDAAYIDSEGRMTPDPRQTPLSARGRREAAAMGELLASAKLDRAVCSGLPRTVETAELVLRDKRLPLERVPELEEVRGGARGAGKPIVARDVAYSIGEAVKPGGRFLGGESFLELELRVMGAVERLVAQLEWTQMLLVAHGGVNRVILGWALGAGLHSAPHMEQDSGCVNVIDLDHDPEGKLIRTLVRALNVTALDPAKHEHWLTTLERQGKELDQLLARAQGRAS